MRKILFILFIPIICFGQGNRKQWWASNRSNRNHLSIYNNSIPATSNASVSGGVASRINWVKNVPSVLSGNVYSASFDGSINTGIDFTNPFGAGTTTWSVSIWFNSFAAGTLLSGTGQMIIGDITNGNDYIRLLDNTHIRVGTASGNSKDFIVPTISPNTWYNLIVTNNAGTWHVYINGTESSSGGQAATSSAATFSELGTLSQGKANPAFQFNGYLSECYMFANKLLSAGDISNLSTNTNIPAGLSVSPDLTMHLNDGVNGYYNRPCTGSNISWTASVPSALSGNVNSVSLNGTTSKIPFYKAGGYSSWTVSLWFNPSAFGGMFFGTSTNSSGNDYLRLLDATHIRVQHTTGTFKDFVVPTMSTGTWYHLLVTNVSGNWHVYLNGTESSSGGQTTSGTFPAWDEIGTMYNGSFGFFYGGSLADVYIFYNTASALTANDISILSSGGNTSGLSVYPDEYFKMNEGSGSTINNYAYKPEIYYAAGKTTTNSLQSMTTNSQRQLLYCNSNPSLNVTSGVAFTAAFWCQFYSYPTASVIFSKDDDLTTTGSEYYCGYYSSYSGVVFQVETWPCGGTTVPVIAPQTEVTLNTWHFIVAWYDPSAGGSVNIQVDNGTVHTASLTHNCVNVTTTPFSVGCDYDTNDPLKSGSFLNGRINSLSIWKRTLSSAEITTLYNAGVGYSIGTMPSSFNKNGLISWWDLNETSGNRADSWSH